MRSNSRAGTWIGVGVGVGAAIGAATSSLALGIAIGIAIGAALGFGLDRAPARDHAPLLREAIAEARAAGFGPAADALESACFKTAFTTSSELLQEHGLAIERFLKATGDALPRSIRDRLTLVLRSLRRDHSAKTDAG